MKATRIGERQIEREGSYAIRRRAGEMQEEANRGEERKEGVPSALPFAFAIRLQRSGSHGFRERPFEYMLKQGQMLFIGKTKTHSLMK